MNWIALAVIVILATVAVFCGTVVLWADKHGWPDDDEDFPRPDGGEESGPGPDSPARATQPPPVDRGQGQKPN